MSAPFDTDLVIERIKSAGGVLAELREVEGSANYAAIKSLRDFPTPAAYVMLASERGTPGHAGRQKAEVFIGVALAVRNYREQRGEAGKKDLNRFLGALRQCLIGWSPELPGARGFQFVQGDLMDYDDSTLLWVEVYSTQHFIGAGT